MGKPRVAISACLLGQNTRYDGRAKGAPALVDALAPEVEWLPLCPEADAGLGVPRPPMDLYQQPDGRIAAMNSDGRDCSAQLNAWTAAQIPHLRQRGIDGAVLKARSPSCAVGSAPLRHAAAAAKTDGLFAAALKQAMPDLPIAEEDALQNDEQCRLFLTRVKDRQRQRQTRRRLLLTLSLLVALLAIMLSTPAWSCFLPPCPVNYLSGGRWHCPGCGFTRGWQSFLSGDWRGAGHLHPFGFRVLPLLLLLSLAHAGSCRWRRRPWPWSQWLWIALGAFIACWLLGCMN